MSRCGKAVFLIGMGMLLAITFLAAQPPDTLWTRVYGGTGNDEAYSVWETTDGGFVIAGRTNTLGSGSYDIWLLKLDSAGDTMWTETYGGADRELGWSVEQTPDGGYIIGGGTETYAVGGEDFYMVRTDSAGDVLWTQVYGGVEDDELESLTQTPDGGYVMTGKTNSFGAGNGDFWVLKTDVAGDTSWAKTYGGAASDRPYEVRPTSDGGFIVAGWIGDNGFDVYAVKTDASGNAEWEKTWGYADYDGGEGVRQTTEGGYVIVAGTAPTGEGSEDIWLIKTDALGDTVWSKTYGGPDIDWSYGVVQTSDGSYIITGVTNSYGAGDFDTYVVRTDSMGDTTWTATYGGAGYDECYEVRQTSDGGYILVGVTGSFGAGENDVYIIRLETDEEPGVEEDSQDSSLFELSTRFELSTSLLNGETELRYQLLRCSQVRITVYDPLGRKANILIDEPRSPGSHTLAWDGVDGSGNPLPAGVYFIHFEAEGFSQTERLVKLK